MNHPENANLNDRLFVFRKQAEASCKQGDRVESHSVSGIAAKVIHAVFTPTTVVTKGSISIGSH